MKAICAGSNCGAIVRDVCVPELFENSVLCKTTYSFISSGTERLMIKNSVGVPEEVLVKNHRLGYSGAGVVEQVRGNSMNLEVGDRVGFYGAPYVNHSEYVVVPKRLVYKIPEGVSDEEAASCGLGAISMHAFKMGEPSLGEICYIAGLGIVGNLCGQIALAAGCRVAVSDFEESRIKSFIQCVNKGDDYYYCHPDKAIEEISKISETKGADAVYLCMGTDSSKPMEDAVKIIRPGGKIVVAGVLDIRVPRDDFFYKEPDIRISKAGGPGRYDFVYEKMGVDYPYQFVRWTEGRYVQETLRLIKFKKLSIKPLISEIIPLSEIESAYNEIVNGNPKLGYLIKWI